MLPKTGGVDDIEYEISYPCHRYPKKAETSVALRVRMFSVFHAHVSLSLGGEATTCCSHAACVEIRRCCETCSGHGLDGVFSKYRNHHDGVSISGTGHDIRRGSFPGYACAMLSI
jgi:hypothetical protein